MEESEDNMSAEDIKPDISLLCKPKPKKRSLVERELETSLTARITSPITNSESSNTSRYGRARKLKIDPDVIDVEKLVPKREKSQTREKSPVKIQSPVYRMHASNSPTRQESSKVTPNSSKENNLENQIENIYHENISLSRFGSEEKKTTPNKTPKLYVRKDLIQTKEDEESITLIKNLFSPSNSGGKSGSHVKNILERSSEKNSLSTSQSTMQNGYASVVKTLDFDNKKNRKENKYVPSISKSELFEMEAKCEYQVGDLAWSRMGTYPFWPCIVTREPTSEMFVKKKLCGRVEHDIIHVTFFGDNGRRGWIMDNMLRKFHGQLEFEATREQFTPADKKKDPRLYAAFFISEKKQPQWNISVEEAESLFRQPKRLRIDILNDMLTQNKPSKTTPKQSKSVKITRTASDVSLSESLFDTLFSEDDKDDSDKSRNKSRKSLDVSEVVTACLDNMAAKTGNIKIQRQSHMDRWLQKAKSKTPEKSQARLQVIPQTVVQKEPKASSSKKKTKTPKPGLPVSQKPYRFRKAARESQNISSINDFNTNSEFAPSLNSTLNNIENESCDDITSNEELQSGSLVIPKVENPIDSANESPNYDNKADVDSVLTGASSVTTAVNIDVKVEPTTTSSQDEELFNESVDATSSVESTAPSSSSELHNELANSDINCSESNSLHKSKNIDPKDEIPTTISSQDEQLFNESVDVTSSVESTAPSSSSELHNELANTDTNCSENNSLQTSENIYPKDEIPTTISSQEENIFNESVDTSSVKSTLPSTGSEINSELIANTDKNCLDSNSLFTCENIDSKVKIPTKISSKDEMINESVDTSSVISAVPSAGSEINSELITNTDKKYLDSNSLYTSPTEKNISNETGEKSHVSSNKLVNGDITDHDMTEMSSKSLSFMETSQSEVTDTEEENANNALKECPKVSKHICTNPKFKEYFELRQDDLMDQHPELNQDEIEEYLHKTWMYENNITDCDITKEDCKKSVKPKKSNSRSKKKPTPRSRRKKNNTLVESNVSSEEQVNLDSSKDNFNSSDQINNDTPDEIDNICNANNDALVVPQKETDSTHTSTLDKMYNMPKGETDKNSQELNAKDNEHTEEQVCLNRIKDNLDLSYRQINNETPNKILNIFNTNSDTLIDLKKETDSTHTIVIDKINNVPNKETDEKISHDLDVKENLFANRLFPFNKASDKMSFTTFESNKDSLHEDMDISVTETNSFDNEEHTAMEVSCPENEINKIDKDDLDGLNKPQDKNEILTNSEPSETNDICFSNNKPVDVGVSEKTEVEIISNKEKDDEFESTDKNYHFSTLPQDIYEDESSCESIDISYAISPLSVKGDDADEPPIEDFNTVQDNGKSVENTNNENDKSIICNGVLEDSEKHINGDANIVCNVNNTVNEAGLKPNIDTVETKQSIQDQLNPVIEKETVNDIEPAEVKMNGTHLSKFIEDLEGDNLSNHSEDSEPLSVTKSKLKIREQGRVNKYADPEFVKYLEMRQDDLADEHPELSEEEIVEYLYKTWLYEEETKSEIKKSDDIIQSNLVKGLGEATKATKKRKPRDAKEKKKNKKDVYENSDVELESLKSEGIKRWLRPKKYTSKLYADFDSSRDTSPAITDETTDTFSLDSEECRTNNSTPSDELIKPVRPSKTNSKLSLTRRPLPTPKSNEVDKSQTELQNGDVETDLNKTSISKMVNGFKETEVTEIKEEFNPVIVSIKSEESEASLSKPNKLKSKCDKSMDDPEFVKYLELRQDPLIDENPQLTQEEIVNYLYKTWLYEESIKTDIQKTDEVEPSSLVKGLNQDNVMPKRVKKKVKVETDLDDDTRVKPKRKTIQPYYNEDDPDFEDEIAIFEIFKNSPTVELAKVDLQQKSKELKETKPTETPEEVMTVIEIEDEIDEVELYFQQLTKPKPNIFKGLIREKVCEICEKVGNLLKCKGCNGMFHMDCVKNETKIVETKCSVPTRGRKKKKKKLKKSLEDSGSMSDEKSQDVSAENMSVEEILKPELQILDAENFEAQLSAKMKELLESTEKEIHYDSYTSDDGIDWDNSVAGKCEIVDIGLKPKPQNQDFKCNNCQKYDTPICFVCKAAVSKTGIEYRQRCQVAHCHKYYHLECLDHWPQTQFTSNESRNKKTNEVLESHMCPRHVCHTCVCDDPRGCKTRFSGDKLARCIRCPATYHSFTKCLPAGTQILTASHIICPRHYENRTGKVTCHVNTGWCFICALGGTLICCEYCPTSFHAECLNISPPEGNYMCEDCETGRLPLYGEMVWVKLGHYRWWPGLILHPSEIPDNIMAVKHSPGEFVVRFFGQYDHYWVNRGRVFPFQEGDSGKISSQKSKIDADFTLAMEHAQRACQMMKKNCRIDNHIDFLYNQPMQREIGRQPYDFKIWIMKNAQENTEESLDIASSLLPPHYVKLKVNKPFGSLVNKRVELEESSLTQCECDPNDADPCGPYTQCLNRMLLTECGPICRAGERCNNRAFEKRLYPKLVPYRTPHRGWGLKTLEEIKAGQFVIEYVGELIDEEEFRRRMARKHEIRDENFYFLTLDKERMIDAGPKGNLARFMNHCCEPNCETQKWTVLGDVRVGLFAIRDIPPNSEVTFNYLLECASIDKKKCMCGAKRCAGYIGAKPKQEESQPKKNKLAAKRTYKKRKNTEESPSTKNKPKRPVGRPAKPKELTEIEKDLLIIKNATNGLSSDSECNSRLSSLEGDRISKALKRKRVSFSSEDVVLNTPSVKKLKLDEEKSSGND